MKRPAAKTKPSDNSPAEEGEYEDPVFEMMVDTGTD